jgi:hypothetical protein
VDKLRQVALRILLDSRGIPTSAEGPALKTNENSGPDDRAYRFSLVVGGPFHTILRRLGLTDADRLPTGRAAVGLALLAWLPPALLVFAQSLLGGQSAGWEFFADWTAYARFLAIYPGIFSGTIL